MCLSKFKTNKKKNMKTNKAIYIDVVAKTITEIQLGNHFGCISEKIGNGCQYFCCPIIFPNDDAMYVDDESLLRRKDIKGGFTFKGGNPLVGNAIILGTDGEGDSCDVKSAIDEISESVIFIDEEMAKDWAIKALSTPPTIITW